MIKLSYDQVMEKLKETGLSQEELDGRVNQKLEQLAGLISKDGAAHIVANELGVNLFEQFSGKVKIEKLIAGMRNVEVVGKIQQKWDLREFTNARGEGKVQSMLIGDETGVVRVTCWHGATEKITGVSEEDIVLVKNATVRDNQGRLELHLNDQSVVEKNPAGEEIGEVKRGGGMGAAVRKQINALAENDQNIELFGTVVQVFEPRFFEVCPQCGKRARGREGVYNCDAHGAVEPDYSYVLNAILDDGSETIRCVFFREQAEQLLGKSRQEFLVFKDSPDLFDGVKIDLLGQLVKMKGRVTKNSMFDRLEFMTREVDTKPNPDEEIDRLKVET
ncbi:OB-fold nucleic acid binding domain-containing protein [Nanoarchaeota archaeon]